jgi:hypothetical protein
MVFCTFYNWSVDCWNRGAQELRERLELLKMKCAEARVHGSERGRGGLRLHHGNVGVAA